MSQEVLRGKSFHEKLLSLMVSGWTELNELLFSCSVFKLEFSVGVNASALTVRILPVRKRSSINEERSKINEVQTSQCEWRTKLGRVDPRVRREEHHLPHDAPLSLLQHLGE